MIRQHRAPAEAIPRYTPEAGDTVEAAIQRDYLGFLTTVAAKCGDIGAYTRQGADVVLINSPMLVRELLVEHVSDVNKGNLQHTAFRALLGDSVSLSEGDRHQRLRRLLAPLFTRRHVTRYANDIVGTAERLCRSWAETSEIELFLALHRLALHTIGRTLIAEASLWNEFGQFWRARERLWQWINSMTSQGRALDNGSEPILDNELRAAVDVVQETVDHIIHQRVSKNEERDDLLDALLETNRHSRHVLTLTEVRDQIIALFFAAHETSAATLFWSLYLLDLHPRVRRAVEGELDAVLAGRLPSAEDLHALPRTIAVVKEAMRLYPPAGRQFRVTQATIRLGGHAVPTGTPVSVCQYTLHRLGTTFPEPHRFVPERFRSNGARADPFGYIPFGVGDRVCLGRHYAMMETHLLLALLASRFRFTFPEQVRPRLGVTIRPSEAVMVGVAPRLA